MIISGNGATALVKIESRDPQRKQIYLLHSHTGRCNGQNALLTGDL